MKAGAVFAFPSKIDALHLVLLEAMSCGTPVVCTAMPPGPEIVEHEVTGLLADPDSPADFAEKMARILDEPKLAKELSEAARRSVAQRFSLDRCIQETEDFYRECFARFGAGDTNRPAPREQQFPV